MEKNRYDYIIKDKKRLKAVALKYEPEKDFAPYLVAKGEGKLAEEIVAKAKDENIPVIEKNNMASILIDLKIGEFIPVELYHAVAVIFAKLFECDKGEKFL